MTMLEIPIPDQALVDFADRTVFTDGDMSEVYSKIKHEFLQAHLIPIQAMHSQGAPLPIVYTYVQLRDAINEVTSGKIGTLNISREDALLVKESMEGFPNWSLDMAELILIAHRNLTKILGESNGE